MKNRAKCKLCNTVLESFHRFDLVACKCGEISISGGCDVFECAARNWSNFLRVDDNDNEIIVKIDGEKTSEVISDTSTEIKLDRKELLAMLERSIDYIDNLPTHAKQVSVSLDELNAVVRTIHAILSYDEF